MPDTDPKFIFGPTPHEEAIKIIAGKPVVTRAVFDKMLPELRARAFVITGVESANVVESVRNRIADLPAGGDWNEIKKDIVREISPHLVDPTADPDEQARQMAASERRAELLLRTHGFQAYQAAQYEVMDRQRDVLPFWQYLTMGDDHVRDSHAALNNVILPADHDFWQSHYPPWDFGCRCQVVALSESDYHDAKQNDAQRLPEERDVIEGAQLRKLEENGTLFRSINGGVAQGYDVRSPVDRAMTDEDRRAAYRWNPGDMRIPVELLKERYDASTWNTFENFARSQALDSKGTTVWSWMEGSPILPPSAPSTKPEAEPETLGTVLAKLGLDKRKDWSTDDVRALLKEMKEPAPMAVKDVLAKMSGTESTGKFSAASVKNMMQEVMNLLPRGIASSLPKLSVELLHSIPGGALADYTESLGRLRVSKSDHPGENKKALRESVFHEMMHWVHDHGPQGYRAAIRNLYLERTAGEKLIKGGYKNGYRPDKWWWKYAGTQYQLETEKTVAGLEVATTHFQLLSNPERLARLINQKPEAMITENLKTILGVFFKA